MNLAEIWKDNWIGFPNKPFVYKFQLEGTKQVYIGKDGQGGKRFHTHKHAVQYGVPVSGGRLLHEAIIEHGPEKFDWTVEWSGDTNEEANEIEIFLIKHYRANCMRMYDGEGLGIGFNQTDGGEGAPGPRDTTIHHFVHMDGREFKGTRNDFKRKYDLNPGNLSDVLTGKYKTIKGWRLSTTPLEVCGSGSGIKDTTIHHFVHKDGREFKGTRNDFKRKYDLNPGSLSSVLNGK